MTAFELAGALDRHDKWLARVRGGVRLDLSGRTVRGGDFRGRDLSWARFGQANLAGCKLDWCDLRSVDFRDADLSTVTFCRSILAGSVLTGARINWSSPELVGELLACSATTDPQQALAARVADGIRGPWPYLARLEADPEWPWALEVLGRYPEFVA